jgi:hypothetical protein
MEVAVRQGETSRTSTRGNRFARQGFSVTVGATQCLVIEDDVGCEARIVGGQAWITADNTPHDTIAAKGTGVLLERGVRTHVSAFHERAAILITPPQHLGDVAFTLYSRHGTRLLTVKSRPSYASLAGGWAAVAAMFKRWLAAARLTTVQGAQP